MKWCLLLLLLRGAGGRTRHGFRNATRAVRLPNPTLRGATLAWPIPQGGTAILSTWPETLARAARSRHSDKYIRDNL